VHAEAERVAAQSQLESVTAAMRNRWLSAAAVTLIVGVFAIDWLSSSRSAKSEEPETTEGALLVALYFARGESLPSPDPAH
jgi:hypothetical protein